MNVVVQTAVLNTLRRSEVLTIGEIAEASGRSESSVRTAVRALIVSGEIVALGVAFSGGHTYATSEYAAQMQR
jgi:predicted transcriptional regulator